MFLGWVCRRPSSLSSLPVFQSGSQLVYFLDSSQRMPNTDVLPSSTFPYERSSTGYSASVQLYAHSGELPTGALLRSRSLIAPTQYRFACDTPVSPHHLFSIYPASSLFQQSTLEDIQHSSSAILEDIASGARAHILDVIPPILSPSSLFEWPHGLNC